MADLRFPLEDVRSEVDKDDPLKTPVRPRVTFLSYKWETAKPTLQETKMTEGGTTSTTTLYLPNGFTEKYGASWGEQEIVTALVGGVWDVSKEGMASSAIEATQTALKSQLPGIVNTAAYATGKTAFPGQFLVFQKGEPINLDFTFDFLPRNEQEASTAVKICENFKDKILPTYGEGGNAVSSAMLTFPDVWRIMFTGAKGIGFPTTKSAYADLALVSCNVGYGGGANSALTFYDANPVVITLSLSFKGIKHAYKR